MAENQPIPMPVKQNIAERIKARYPSDLQCLDDSCRQLIHELQVVREDVAEAQSKRGGQVQLANENKISSAYRALMKKIGVLQALQQSGVYNPTSK